MEKEKMFMCPKCKKEIDAVNIISESWQRCRIDSEGNIIEYGDVEMGDIQQIECSECLEEITKDINV